MNDSAPLRPIRLVRRPFAHLSGLIILSLTALIVTACSGSSPAADGASASPTPSATPTPCPGVSQPSKVGRWPAPLPADLPKPPSGTPAKVVQTNQVLSVIRTTTRISLRDAVIFVLREFPKLGFTLGRGDAEAGQADAPFVRSGVFGQVRLNYAGPCATQWLIAIGAPRQGTSPLLPPPSTAPSSLPPFGG